MAWIYEDEQGQPDRLIDCVMEDSAVVPAHWVLEIVNTLFVGERRGRLKAAKRPEILARLQALPIRIDDETPLRGWREIPELAERFGLTAYDAAYLELAMRADAPLATLDRDLARAARAARVALFA
jgi:predicted nucleic acid-binding protein